MELLSDKFAALECLQSPVRCHYYNLLEPDPAPTWPATINAAGGCKQERYRHVLAEKRGTSHKQYAGTCKTADGL